MKFDYVCIVTIQCLIYRLQAYQFALNEGALRDAVLLSHRHHMTAALPTTVWPIRADAKCKTDGSGKSAVKVENMTVG
jgi:hypothetical protein